MSGTSTPAPAPTEPAIPSARRANELRLFISSTFRDLQAEREHLVKKIFPEVRSLCRARGINFTEVDLRWGLTEEDDMRGQVIGTCLEEIDRCRPYFIGVTGERYGYVPELHEIYRDPELLERYPWIEDAVMDETSITDLEFRHGVLNDPASAIGYARFFFRGDGAIAGETREARLLELEDRVRACGAPVQEYDDPASLGEQVLEYLMDVIDRDFAGVNEATPLEEVRARHEAFAASRRRAYIPNAVYLKRLNEFVVSDQPALAAYAESGSGKSALLSYWAAQYRRKNPEAFVVEHYVGIGAGRTDHLEVMRHVMMEIRERFAIERELPSTVEAIEREFPNWLAEVQRDVMVLVIDGLNQLDNESLAWLPRHMPPNVRLIVSTTVEGTLVAVRERGWQQMGVQPLSEGERQAVTVRFLGEYRKALAPELVKQIAVDAKCAQPLFLRTLLEELRVFGHHERIGEAVADLLATTGPEDLFQKVLERLETDFGADSVRHVMSLLWASRRGLGEPDLVELTGLPRIRLSSMLTALEYHLLRGDGRLTFFHDYLRRAVEKRYLPESRRRSARMELASYLLARPMTAWSAWELPWQLREAGDAEGLKAALSRIDLLDRYVSDGGHYELLAYWKECGGFEEMERIYTGLLGDGPVVSTAPDGESDGAPDDAAAREARFLSGLIALYRHAGLARRAIPIGRRALAAAEASTSPVPDYPGIARALGDLGAVLVDAGELAAAQPVVERALAIHRGAFGPESRETARSLNTLARLHFQSGDYVTAERYFRRAYDACLAAHGADHLATARTANNLGATFLQRNDYAAAEPHMVRYLAICESVLGPDHPDTAEALSNMAALYLGGPSAAKAEPLMRRAIAIAERALGPDHLIVSLFLGNLARSLSGPHARDEAVAMMRRALDLSEAKVGAAHPHSMMSLMNLAARLVETASYAEAEALLRRGAATAESVRGAPNPNAAWLLESLGEIRALAGDMKEAEELFRRSMAIHASVSGPDSPEAASATYLLARLLADASRGEESVPLFERALRVFEAHSDTYRSRLLACGSSYALLLAGRGQQERAAVLASVAMHLLASAPGEPVEGSIDALVTMGEYLVRRGDLEAASELLERACDECAARLHPDHADAARAALELGRLRRAQGRPDEAGPLLDRAAGIYRRNWGDAHPGIARAGQ